MQTYLSLPFVAVLAHCPQASPRNSLRALLGLALLLGLVALLLRADPAAAEPGGVSAERGFISLSTSNGRKFRAFVAGPQDATVGAMLVHDYFGISDSTTLSVARLGTLGYRVIAVDLYGGKSATSDEEATRLMKALDQDAADEVLQAGLDYLKNRVRTIATVGFSMGGLQALIANLNDPVAVAGTVIVYGGSYQNLSPARVGLLQSPVLAIAGAEDDWAASSALEFLELARARYLDFSLYLHPRAGHAYAQPLFHGGANYSAEATRLTWLLIDDFLAHRLAGL